jgi:hypothetical protein
MATRLSILAGFAVGLWAGTAAADDAADDAADTLIDVLDHYAAVAITRVASHPDLFGDAPSGVFTLHRDHTPGPMDGILGPDGRALLAGKDICLYVRNRPENRFDALVFTAGPGRFDGELLTRAIDHSALRAALIDESGAVRPPHPLWQVDLADVTVTGCLPGPGHLALYFGAQRYVADIAYGLQLVVPRDPSGRR